MRHLSRHITLNWDYFGYFRSQKYLPRFRNLTAIVFALGHLKLLLATYTAKMCNIFEEAQASC